jgi:hypothetical protein
MMNHVEASLVFRANHQSPVEVSVQRDTFQWLES